FFQAEDGIRDKLVTGVQTCALPISRLGIRGVPLFDYFLDYNYGRFLLKERKLQERKVQLDRAVSLTPETRPVYHERGKLNVILGDYQQARRDAEQAYHIFRIHPASYW